MREYRVWRKDEERALRRGVTKHGTGAWEMIRTDSEFADTLKDRTGVQLKDKWRNLVKFNHLSPEEMKASCGGSARTRSGLRQRAAQRSLSPGGHCLRTTPRRVASPGPSGPAYIETDMMSAVEKESLLRHLQGARSQLVAAPPDCVSTGGSSSAMHAQTPSASYRDSLVAVDAVIGCVRASLGCPGSLRLPQQQLQRCPAPVGALLGRHLPPAAADLFTAVAAASACGDGPERASPLLTDAMMAGATKVAKAAMEHGSAPSVLGSPPAAAAAAALSPVHSSQHSGEMQRKRSRDLAYMDDMETKAAGRDDGENDERNVRQVAAVITTGDLVGPPAATGGARVRAGPHRCTWGGLPHRRRHSVGRASGTLSARDLMVTGMRDSGKRAVLPSYHSTRHEGADSASEHSAAHVEDDFLQSLYLNCFSKHSDSTDALLYAPSPCPPSPTWGGGQQQPFVAPTRASAPQLPIGCGSPRRAGPVQRQTSSSSVPAVHRPGSMPAMISCWPPTSLGAVSSGATVSPPLSGSSAATVGPATARSNTFGMYPTSGHGHSYGAPSSGMSHPSSVSSLIAHDAALSPAKAVLPKTLSTSSGGSYTPMDTVPPLRAQPFANGASHSSSRTADTSDLEKLLGWGPQHAPQRLPAHGRYTCVGSAAGPPMSMTGFSADIWTMPTMASGFRDDKAPPGGCALPSSPCGGPSEGSGSAGGSLPGGVVPGIHPTPFADMTDPYGASLFPRGDFQGVLDSLNELDSCYERAPPDGEDFFPSCRSTMSFV